MDDTASEYVQGVHKGRKMIDAAFPPEQLGAELSQTISDGVTDVLEYGHWKGLDEDEIATVLERAARQFRDEVSAAAKAAEEAPLPISID